MKQIFPTIAAFVSTLGFILFAVSPVFAAETLPVCTDARAAASTLCNDRARNVGQNPLTGPNGLITRAARIMAWITGVASVVMIVVGGFRFVTSDGDASAALGARKTVMYAVIGFVISLFGQAIVSFVLVKI